MHLKEKYTWIKHFDFIVIDLVCLMISFIFAYYLKFNNIDIFDKEQWSDLFIIVCADNLIITFCMNTYSGTIRRRYYDQFIREIPFFIYQIVSICLLFYVMKIGTLFSREMMITMYCTYFIISHISKYIRKKIILKNDKIYKRIPIMIISDRATIEDNINNVLVGDMIEHEIKYLYIVDDNKEERKINGVPVIKNYKNKDIEEVFIATNPSNISQEIYKYFINNGICIHINIEDITGFEIENSFIQRIGNYTTLSLDMFTYDANKMAYFAFKRLFDIIFGLIGMCLIIPFAIIIKVSYMITGDFNSIFYTHKRVGKNGKIINIYKFRSMVSNAKEILEELLKDEKYKKEWEKNQKIENDPRITKVGKVIRKLSIDEIPQFINVLKGDMSIIGPRPLVEGELEFHNGLQLYNKIKPGITGWWACNGRSNIEYRERLELEYYYIQNCSLSLDLTCIIRTILCLAKKEGVQ